MILEIRRLYYEEHYYVWEIARKLKVSEAYVVSVLGLD